MSLNILANEEADKIINMKSIITDRSDPYIDPIFSITQKFNQSENPKKINLGVGVYRNSEGKSMVMKVVRKIERDMVENNLPNKDYLPITGSPDFVNGALKLIFGTNCFELGNGKIQGVQTISGTGALRLSLEFLSKYNGIKTFYHSSPTWPIHISMLNQIEAKTIKVYPYYNTSRPEVAWEEMSKKLNNAPPKSAAIIQLCGHNPSGIDLNEEHWKMLAKILINKEIIPIFDVAYLGLAAGCVDLDSYPIRLFYSLGKEMIICMSFSKIMGLYNERVGMLGWYLNSQEASDSIKNRLKVMIRNNYSNPPAHGALIASRILNESTLFLEWKRELNEMSKRIFDMRNRLFQNLVKLKTPGDWSFITRQKGLFSYTGLTKDQVKHIEEKFDIYMPQNGRINVSALTQENLDYVSLAFHDAVKKMNVN